MRAIVGTYLDRPEIAAFPITAVRRHYQGSGFHQIGWRYFSGNAYRPLNAVSIRAAPPPSRISGTYETLRQARRGPDPFSAPPLPSWVLAVSQHADSFPRRSRHKSFWFWFRPFW